MNNQERKIWDATRYQVSKRIAKHWSERLELHRIALQMTTLEKGRPIKQSRKERRAMFGKNPIPSTGVMLMPAPMKVVVEPATASEQAAERAIALADNLQLPAVANAIRAEIKTGTLRRAVLTMLQEEEIAVYPWLGVARYLEHLRKNESRRLNPSGYVITRVDLDWVRIALYSKAVPIHALELIARLRPRLEALTTANPTELTAAENRMLLEFGQARNIAYDSSTEMFTIDGAKVPWQQITNVGRRATARLDFAISQITYVRDPFLVITGAEGDPIVIAHWDEPGYKLLGSNG